MDPEQQQRFEQAVERKKAAAKAASEETGAQNPAGDAVHAEQQPPRLEHGRPQDVLSPRDKNSGKGKKTADKWNQ